MANFPTSVSTDANLYVAVNGLQTTLAVTCTDTDTTLTLTSTSSFPTTGMVTIDNNEVVSYTGISGSQLTGCTRGADGTTALPHNLGVTVGLTVVAAHHNRLKDEIIAVEGALGAGFVKGNLTAASSKIAVTGGTAAVIGSGSTVDLGTVNINDLADVTISTPSSDQVLKYNGAEWVNAPGTTASAGNGIEFFMDDTNIIPTGTNNAIEVDTLTRVPTGTPENIVNISCTNNTVLGQAHLYNTAMNRTEITAGVWDFDTWAFVNSVAGGRVSSMSLSICRVRPVTGTSVTITGSGTSRTATASGGTYFNTTDIVASATNTLASYLQTPQGLYQITARTSDTVVTISTPTTYANESAVAFSVWKQLFSSSTGTIASTSTTLFSHQTVQPAYPCVATDKLGQFDFATSNNTTTVSHTENGTAHYSHVASPLATLHNDLAGLQGGTASERYHLNAAELAIAQNALVTTGGSMTGDITMSNQKAIVFKETTGSGTDSVTLKAPASVTTSYTLQLPPAIASSNQVLTDVAGDGVLSWQTPSAGVTYVREDYVVGTASGNYTGSTTVFDLVSTYTPGNKTLIVCLDGDVQTIGASVDYLETDSNTVTFNNALVTGQKVAFLFSQNVSAAGVVSSATAGQVAYYSASGPTVVGTNAATVAAGGNLVVTGTATNDSAAAGKVGEYVSSAAVANAASSGAFYNVTSISLTAGDWDVSAGALVSATGTTYTSYWEVATSLFSANTTTDHVLGDNYFVNRQPGAASPTEINSQTIPSWRVSIASTTTVYLKAKYTYSGGTPGTWGRLSARRVR